MTINFLFHASSLVFLFLLMEHRPWACYLCLHALIFCSQTMDIYTSIVFIVHLLFIYYILLYIYGLLNTLIKRYLT